MDLIVLLLALALLGTAAVVLATVAAWAVVEGRPLRPSAALFSALLHEWGAWLLMGPLLLSGLGDAPPRRAPPAFPAEPRPPVLLVHGYALNRGSFRILAAWLRRCGWDWVWAINHHPDDAPVADLARNVALAVERLKAESGAPQVDVVAHSMGGVVTALALQHHGIAGSVRRLVTLGTPWAGTGAWVFGFRGMAADLAPGSAALGHAAAPPCAVTSLWTPLDTIVLPPRSSVVPWAPSVEVGGTGHLGLLMSLPVFHRIGEALARPDAPPAPHAAPPPPPPEEAPAG